MTATTTQPPTRADSKRNSAGSPPKARSDRELMPPPPPKKRRTVTPPQSPQTTPASPQSAASEDDAVGQRNYGEEGYWEERYKRQLDKAKRREQQQQQREEKKSAPANEDEEDDDDDVTSEWYYDWKTLTPLLDITPSMRQSPVLDLGCGLSALFSDLLADGFTGPLVAIDSAPSVLTEQRGRFPAAAFPNVSFISRSLFSTAYRSASPSEHHRYGLIVDKATSDGIMCASYIAQPPAQPASRTPPVLEMYRMVGHCLAPGGTFLCVSVQEPDSAWCRELMMAGLIDGAEGGHGGLGGEERKDGGVEVARRWGWRVDVHSIGGEGDAEYYDGEKEGPNVYVIQKLSRERRSRAVKRAATNEETDDAITISRHFH